jgi:hypothetical protein
MSLLIKKISRCAICLIMNLAFVLLAAKSSYSAEHAEYAPIIYAFYCSSEEIAFIGELIPPLSLVDDDKVKAELDLSETQIEKMKEVNKAFFVGVKDVLTRNENKGRELMRSGGTIEDHVVAIGKLSEDARKRTNEILKPHQLARMNELLLQLKGVLTIPKKDLRQLLGLDRKQERAIDEIRSDIFKRINETTSPDSVIASTGRCKFVASTKREIAILLEESEKSVYRLLSPEQKENVEKLKGKSFSF